MESALQFGKRWWPYFASAALFAIIGIISRSSLRETETRWQIVAGVTVAALLEPLRNRLTGYPPKRMGFALNALAVAFAMFATKVAIEGEPDVPPILHTLIAMGGAQKQGGQ